MVKGSRIETLSYYSSKEYPLGSILNVPIRQKEQPAVVINIKPASAAKTALRAATFTLRKISEQKNIKSLPPTLISTAKELSETIPAEIGAILYSQLPNEVKRGEIILHDTLATNTNFENADIAVLQNTYSERFRIYRSRIRETFAHRGSVLFVVPTVADLEQAENSLKTGIEKRVVTFSSSFTTRRLKNSYESLADLSHAKLIITTPSHAFLDRHDITQIIIDQSRSRAYKNRFRPYLDLRESLKITAKLTGRKLLLGDILPRTEDEWQRRNESYLTEEETRRRIAPSGKLEIIKRDEGRNSGESFSVFCPELISRIEEIHSQKKNVFMYSARRGLAPLVACFDCGHILRCPDSGTPYTLFKTEKNGEEHRWFISSASGKRVRAADTCDKCGSWRLRERGIGIQNLEKELKKIFPHIPVLLFDHTTATTMRKATRIIGDFTAHKGAILLGTAMAIPCLQEPVAYSIVTSLDAARSIPTWRGDEDLLALLLTLRDKTNDTCFIQTRSEPHEIIDCAISGSVSKFYDEELILRETLNYPPFFHFIHLTLQGKAEAVQREEEKITNLLQKYKPHFYYAPTTTYKKTIRHGLIRVSNEAWPSQDLMDRLRSLPPQVRVEVDPDRVV